MELGDRMKLFENAYRIYLPPRMPIIIRVDGKAFHTLTRGCEKPFDAMFAATMDSTATALLEEVQDARMAYVQSDEVSLLLIGYNTFASEHWFSNNLQKMVSISAAVAAATFTMCWGKEQPACFDSRVFILPENEVCNYMLWRQQDATRNSIQMVAQSMYSHKQLLGKNCNELQEMVFQKGINWNDYEPYWKRGRVITKEGIDRNIPIFTEDRQYIERFMEIEEK
jgi:tRNA(His) 5'-end guanylyltransferase